MRTVKCLYCGKVVGVMHSQNVKPHLCGPGKCIGSGMRVAMAVAQRRLSEEVMQKGVKLAEKFKR